ncbi:hypothetical protein P9858_18775 [Niallia circulans]|uniref:hypothetical protein n=1 Tax=Niallia circulans TaxID=1397 RepID=UPI002E20B7DA|nr:hypothetical protein [Niallia circulans]
MTVYILAVMSLIFVVPVLYFLPLGLSNRGKFTIIGLAFCISAIGLLSRELFSFWQSILIMLLFLISASYLLLKNWSTILFVMPEDVEDSVIEKRQEPRETKDLKTTQNDVELEEDIIPFVPEVNQEDILTNEAEIIQEETVESIGMNLDVMKHLEVVKQEEEFLLSIEEEVIDREIDKEIDKEPVETNYLAEIEKMLEENDPSTAIKTSEEIDEEDQIEEIFFSIGEDAEVAVSVEKMEQEQLWNDLADNAITEEEKTILSEEMTAISEHIEEVQEDSAVEMMDEQAELSLEQSQENQIGLDGDKHENVVSGLAHKIINNTLAQLELLQNAMDMEEFETVLTQCLKKPIPLNEYFAYSALLIDVYVQNKEEGKLENLLYSLREKFMEQPIVLEQIKFMEEKYMKV